MLWGLRAGQKEQIDRTSKELREREGEQEMGAIKREMERFSVRKISQCVHERKREREGRDERYYGS